MNPELENDSAVKTDDWLRALGWQDQIREEAETARLARCGGRRRYASKEEASASGRRSRRVMLRVRCARCGGWHLQNERE